MKQCQEYRETAKKIDDKPEHVMKDTHKMMENRAWWEWKTHTQNDGKQSKMRLNATKHTTQCKEK